MSKFNIGDKVISKGYPYCGDEVGVVVGIDLGEEICTGKYLVKFDSLDICSGWACGTFHDDADLVIEPYEGYAQWVDEDDIVKVEDEYEEKCKEDNYEEDIRVKEEDIRMEFDKIREEKKEVIKKISEKVLEMTLEIKEMEHEIEKIKKEWHLE